MAQYILQTSYDIAPGKADAFVALANDMKAHFAGELRKRYAIYDVKGRKHSFVEQFVCESQQEFDALEDDMTEKSEQLLQRLNDLVVDGSLRSTSLIQR